MNRPPLDDLREGREREAAECEAAAHMTLPETTTAEEQAALDELHHERDAHKDQLRWRRP